MPHTTITKSDKIKLLDQMLEDLAGDEFEEYEVADNSADTNVKHYDIAEDLEVMETYH